MMQAARKTTPARGRVLLAEDDDLMRESLSRVLCRAGFEVCAVDRGRAALDELRAASFDVVLSDIGMPEMDGIEMLRHVRSSDLDVPVVLITGHADADTAMDAIEWGAAGYLRKPIDLENLISQIDRAKNLHDIARLQRQLRVEDVRLDAERAELTASFEEALEKCYVVFQPVVRSCAEGAHWTVVGWEAYVRSAAPTLSVPSELIGAAVRLGRMQELGRRVRDICAKAWMHAPDDALLFINLHPLELEDPELAGPSSPLLPIANRVVLEITERTFLSSVDSGVERISHLRDLGFLLAIDDIGHGYASLNTCVNIEPDFIKLDRSLVAGIESSPTQSRLVAAVTDLARDIGASLIAESVETMGELARLQEMGCRSFQGHLFAAPDTGLPAPSFPSSITGPRSIRS